MPSVIKLAGLIDRLFPKRPSPLQLLRPAVATRAATELRGGLGQAADFYRQAEQKIGKGAAALYYGKAKGLGRTTRQDFLAARSPRRLAVQRAYTRNPSEEALHDAAMDNDEVLDAGREIEQGLIDELAARYNVPEDLLHDKVYSLDSLRDETDVPREAIRQARRTLDHEVRNSSAYERAYDDLTTDQFEGDLHGARQYDTYDFTQRLDAGPGQLNNDYWDTAVLDPSQQRLPREVREGLQYGAHFQNPWQLGHARGIITPDSDLMVHEVQSDPFEALGSLTSRLRNTGTNENIIRTRPGLEQRYRTPHATIAKALLERAAADPEARSIMFPNAQKIMSVRGNDPGTAGAMSRIYDSELPDALGPYLEPYGGEGWQRVDLDRQRSRILEEGLEYRRGGLARIKRAQR